jgi:iron-sulfur cluster repair protein YtfE (RIC family)
VNTGTLPREDLTVNETIRRWPATVAVFNAFAIDACCGGAVPIRDAALRDGADPAALLEALAAVIDAGRIS